MSYQSPIDRLVDPSVWRASPIVGDLLVTEISISEAAQLGGPGEARDLIEAFIEAHRVVAPFSRGLLLFIIGPGGEIADFVEVYPDQVGGVAWHGPHRPVGAAVPADVA